MKKKKNKKKKKKKNIESQLYEQILLSEVKNCIH